MRVPTQLSVLLLFSAACAPRGPAPAPTPEIHYDTVVVERVVERADTVPDPDTQRRLAQLEAEVLQRDARIQLLEERLEDARREVVRTMARMQSVASRAEAASGIAEAELALRTLRATAGRRPAPETSQVEHLLQLSGGEFDKANYGGAMYLASQARTIAGQGTERLQSADATGARPGETPFEAPLRLRTSARANLREGPGTGFAIVFTLDKDQPLTGQSYVEGWVRVSDATGRSGWIARSLVERRD
jgi:hypothetical protein